MGADVARDIRPCRPGVLGGSLELATPRPASRGTTLITPVVLGAGGALRLHLPDHLTWPGTFEVRDATTSRLMLSNEDVTRVRTAWADRFEAQVHGAVLLRLYRPTAAGPRPLILFLHGGGEAGDDNWAQLVGTFGAAHLARTYPDFFVMAPQAPAPPGSAPPPQGPFAAPTWTPAAVGTVSTSPRSAT